MFESFINDKFCSLCFFLFFCAKIYIKKEKTLSSFVFIFSYSFPFVYKLFYTCMFSYFCSNSFVLCFIVVRFLKVSQILYASLALL